MTHNISNSLRLQKGFLRTCRLMAPEVCEYWEVRHHLNVDNNLVLLDQRIIIPTSQCTKILCSLHSAHQGEVSMKAHANESVYWPGMNVSIRTTRANCTECSKIAPSQPREPLTLTVSPDWPFQQIMIDLSHVGSQTYLACADRLTGWLIIHHLNHRQANALRLISICRDIFQTYRAPEELSSYG